MNRSNFPLVSPGARLLAALQNKSLEPSGENTGAKLKLFACPPLESVLTRVTSPVVRSLMKMSKKLFVSPGTRLVATLSNATLAPAGEKRGAPDEPAEKDGRSPCAPLDAVLMRVIAPVTRSLRKRSVAL